MATLPGEPGWLPSIPGPPEWPYLDVRVAELMATRRRDHEGVELQINQEFAGGQWEMAYLCQPQPFDNKLIGPLPQGVERTIHLPPHPLYGRATYWAASKFYVRVMPDGSHEVIRRDARVLKSTLPSWPGRWLFFARRAPQASTFVPTSRWEPSPNEDTTPKGPVMDLALSALRKTFKPDGVPPDGLSLKEIGRHIGFNGSRKVLSSAIKHLKAVRPQTMGAMGAPLAPYSARPYNNRMLSSTDQPHRGGNDRQDQGRTGGGA